MVKYALREDLELCYHYDNAEVTLNVSLGKDFTEGNLFFGDMRQVHIRQLFENSQTGFFEIENLMFKNLLVKTPRAKHFFFSLLF